MSTYPPNNQKEWCKILIKLGFRENHRVGIGGHAKKFYHPEKHSSNFREQPDFIIIQHKMYKQMSQKIVKELRYWKVTENEIKEVS